MTEKELLDEQCTKSSQIDSIANFINWRTETTSILSAIYGDKSSEYKNFCDMGLFIYQADESDLPEYIESAQSLLNGCSKAIEMHCSKVSNNKPQNKNNVVINNNPNFSQSQTQRQTQTQNIEDIIRDEIPASRMREIEEILKTKGPEKTKLEKVGDILQKVGIGVTSSVLARIITSSMGVF